MLTPYKIKKLNSTFTHYTYAGMLVAASFFPEVCFAADSDDITKQILPLLKKIDKFILNPILVLLFFVAALYFFWGLFLLLSNVDDVKARTDGKTAILWGMLGMVIMIGAFGIISLVINTFGLDTPTIIK